MSSKSNPGSCLSSDKCRQISLPNLIVLTLTLCLVWNVVVVADMPEAVGFWRFEGNTADSGRAHNNGILKGTATLVSDPQRGGCLKLDGDGYVDIPSGVTELGDGDFSIAAWIKTTEVGVPILSKSNGNAEWEETEKELYIADSELSEGQNDGTIEYVGHSCDWIRGSTSVNDGRWHHVAITWDADSEQGLVYVDGVEGTDDVGFAGLNDNVGDSVRIGFCESAHSGGNFVGLMDDVAIFDVALSPQQVFELVRLSGAVKGKPTTSTAQKRRDTVTLDTDPNLVGWWKFDDVSGKIAADSSRHGRKGTLKGGLSFDTDSVSGRIGKALKFDGEDEYVQISGYKGVTGTRPRTVAAWLKTTADEGEIVSWGTDDYGKMWMFRFIRGRVGVTPNGGYLYINDAVHDNQWHHLVAVVQDAELPNLHDDVRLYKDGEQAAIHDIGLLDLWPVDTGNELDVRIGSEFKGLIDDVRIYDRALSDDEVRALFKLESNRPL
jgi:hypothetical protein